MRRNARHTAVVSLVAGVAALAMWASPARAQSEYLRAASTMSADSTAAAAVVPAGTLSDSVTMGPSHGRVRLERGQAVELQLRDGSRASGVYLGSQFEAFDRYAARYRRWRAASADSARIPIPGQPVTFPNAGLGCIGGGTLVGFHPLGVEVRRGKDSTTLTAEFGTFRHMRIPGGHSFERRTIEKWVEDGGMPWLTALRLRESPGDRLVPVDSVVAVRATSGTEFQPVARQDLLVGSSSDELSVSIALEAGSFVWLDEHTPLVGVRFSPGPGVRRWGLDGGAFLVPEFAFAIGDLSLAYTIARQGPAALALRTGPGLFIGSGFLGTWNFGAGLSVALGRAIGLRLDYTRHRIFGADYPEAERATDSIMFGIAWTTH